MRPCEKKNNYRESQQQQQHSNTRSGRSDVITSKKEMRAAQVSEGVSDIMLYLIEIRERRPDLIRFFLKKGGKHINVGVLNELGKMEAEGLIQSRAHLIRLIEDCILAKKHGWSSNKIKMQIRILRACLKLEQ